jgi:glutathionylspermidine synthase
MRRIAAPPRIGWRQKVEEAGLLWHSAGGGAYWNEAAFYELTAREVDELEGATNDLHRLALAAVQHVVDNRLYGRLAIPPLAVPLIEDSWEHRAPSLYGRFDFSYDGVGPPKLLEYNADTPTALLEAAVVQWQWLCDCHPEDDQFNSLHERLIAAWQSFRPLLAPGPIHFCSLDDAEDSMTLAYVQDTASQAGYETFGLAVGDIGWSRTRRVFVGLAGEPLRTVFKLYPWEWMVRERFAEHLGPLAGPMRWIEPAWKMVLSNKGILPLLWQLNPDHPNLLPAFFDSPRGLTDWVSKPLLSREGANVEMSIAGRHFATGGAYGGEGRIFQGAAPPPVLDGRYPVLGSWIVGEEAGGLGIRESAEPITTNHSQFVPHLFR